MMQSRPEVYKSNNYVVFDFETTNLNKGDATLMNNHVVCVSYFHPDKGYRTVYGNEFQQDELLDWIREADFSVAHNFKFDMQWLRRCGLDKSYMPLAWCTQVAEFVLAGNRRLPLNLNDTAARYGLGSKQDLISKMMKGGVCPSDMPKRWLMDYATKDVEITVELFNKQRQVVEKEKLLPVTFSRCLLTPVLADIEFNPMQLDSDRVLAVYNKINGQYVDKMLELDKMLGGKNPNSPVQMSEYLYDDLKFKELTDWKGKPKRTPAGKRKADSGTIEKLVAKTKKQRAFLELKREHSKLSAMLTKALKPFKKCAEEQEGKLRFNFNQTIARTHRLTSTGKSASIQGQNMAREFKPLFTTDNKDWPVFAVDYSTLEFSVAGFIGKDKQIYKDINDGFDVHSYTASIIYEKELVEEHGSMPTLAEIKELYGSYRSLAKSRTFKPLYGGKSGTNLEKAYYAEFEKKYSGITKTQDRWIKTVLETKKLKTLTGLTFHWPDTRMSRSGYINNSQSICNYPIQMFATADIVPIGLVNLHHKLLTLGLKSYIVNTIHDSVIIHAHPDELDTLKEICQESLVDKVIEYLDEIYNIQLDMPLGVDIEISSHWEDSDKFKTKYDMS